eukprot:1757_1
MEDGKGDESEEKQTKDELLHLAKELAKVDPIFGSVVINYGPSSLITRMVEKAATIGVVAALIGSMVYPAITARYDVADDCSVLECETLLDIAIILWDLALLLAMITVAITVHHMRC